MAKADETKSNPTGSVYRINYQYVGANYALRSGAYVLQAETEEAAKQKAAELGKHLPFFKLLNVRPYA